MADDKESRGPRDRSRVNVNQDYELRYWTKKFGVSGDQLKEAVIAVGTSAEKVARRLGKSGAA